MEALFSQLSFLANQALDDKNFDPSKIEELLALFEQEACGSWAEHQGAAEDAKLSIKEAEDYLDSLMDAAMADFRSTYAAADRAAAAAEAEEKEFSSLERATHATQKAATGASKKYMDAVMASAVAAMKAAFASSKVHP